MATVDEQRHRRQVLEHVEWLLGIGGERFLEMYRWCERCNMLWWYCGCNSNQWKPVNKEVVTGLVRDLIVRELGGV